MNWKGLTCAVLAVLALFYVAWPAWTGYVIRNAIYDRDAARLAAKVDFDRVRSSLRPSVARKVDEEIDRYQVKLGPTSGQIVGRLRGAVVPKLVDTSVNRLVTPDMIIRIAAERGTIKEALDRILRDQVRRGLPNGVPPEADTPAPAEGSSGGTTPSRITLSNVKSIRFASPLSFRLGIAKDPTRSAPDVTAEFTFTGGDWKLTGIVPRL